VTAGPTRWENPGNITRQSVDLEAHLPCAWVLSADGALLPEALPHAPEVFDRTGRLVEPAAPKEMAREVESAFVSLLKAETGTELGRSDDGSILSEEVEAKFAREETSEPVRAVVRSLLAEAVRRRAAA
jgi:hypothetical protein